MTADPVRPQETLRDRIAQSLAERRVSVQTAPWIVWDALWRGVRIELGHVNAEALADAVLPIMEEETARQLAALRDKVKALADQWRAKPSRFDPNKKLTEDGIGYWRGRSTTFLQCADEVDRLLRALVEEPQPRSGRDVYFDNLRKTAGPRVLAIIDKMQAVEEPQGGEQ